ncbi:hypothetical protein PG985_013544 [Apiospora marii]|uniref:uncharacterized protein n=1 Tax=Apiospora marii TaxID=335849 RepID=UPI00312E7BB9
MRLTATFLAALGLATHAVATPAPTAPTHAAVQPRTGPVRLNQTDAGLEKRQDGLDEVQMFGGWCGIHTQLTLQYKWFTWSTVIRDPEGEVISTNAGNWWDGEICPGFWLQATPFSLDSDLVKYHFFTGDSWGSGPPGQKNDRCSVGDWDQGHNVLQNWRTLDMDCGFQC